MIRPGLCCDKVSYFIFHLSSVLGRKLVMTTSAVDARRWNNSCPSGWARLSVTGFLFRDTNFHSRDLPSFSRPTLRRPSPLGCSTLMTSAPKSPKYVASMGPARMVEASMTLSPPRGRSLLSVSVMRLVSPFIRNYPHLQG